MKKILKCLARFFAGVLLVVVVFVVVEFAGVHTVYEDEHLTVYSDTLVQREKVQQIVQNTYALLSAKDASDFGKVRIILCKNDKSYRRRTFGTRLGSLAQNYSILAFIVCRPMNLSEDIVCPVDSGLSKRSFSSVLAHELMHSTEFKTLGVLTFCSKSLFQKWKLEGFAEYIANSSTLNEKDGLSLFLRLDPQKTAWFEQDKGLWGTVYFYFKSRLRTDYLIRYKGVSEDEFWSVCYDEELLDAEIRRDYYSKKYCFPVD